MKYIYEMFEESEGGAELLAAARLRRSFYVFLEQGIKSYPLEEICKKSGISKRRMRKIVCKNPNLTLNEVASILYSFGKESTLFIEEYGSARSRHREVQSDNSDFTEIIKNYYEDRVISCLGPEDDLLNKEEFDESLTLR